MELNKFEAGRIETEQERQYHQYQARQEYLRKQWTIQAEAFSISSKSLDVSSIAAAPIFSS